jgi:phosphotransferase system enzyme I (PtsI)
VSKLYQELHPAVLRTVKHIIDAGRKQKKWVGMCGEMAGNPLATILLVGMGLDQFSVIPAILPEIKKIIRSIKYKDAQKVAKRALTLSTQEDVEEYLTATICRMCRDVPIPGKNL